jgi:16S rRNA (cytosine1402-N4)-methyltransferase
MLSETLKMLNINPNGVYVDATAGGGGFSAEVVARLGKNGRLIAIDCDPDAVCACQDRFFEFKNVDVLQANFSDLSLVLQNLGIKFVDGIAFDLGLSSFQIDTPERGFSYMHDASIDMRMSKTGISAFDLLNSLSMEELSGLFYKFGEERFSSRIARDVVLSRKKTTIKTTFDLLKIIKKAIPYYNKSSARKIFQALRIAVNKELENLEKGLDFSLKFLKKGARLVVISFHSLEDRIVKQKFRLWSSSCRCPVDFPVCICGNKSEVKVITKKPIMPSAKETKENPRSHSGKLRVCEKI